MQVITAKEMIALLKSVGINYQVKDGRLKLDCGDKELLKVYKSRIIGSDLERKIVLEIYFEKTKDLLEIFASKGINYYLKENDIYLEGGDNNDLHFFRGFFYARPDFKEYVIKYLKQQELKQYKAGAALEFLLKQNYYRPEKQNILPVQNTKQEEPKNRGRILSWLENLFRREKI